MDNNPLFDGEGIEFDHLQRVGQQRQAAELRRLLEEQSRQRRGVCPCPHCGGGIPKVGVSVCMHCRRDLHWHNGFCAATIEKARQLAAEHTQRVASETSRLISKKKRQEQRQEEYAAWLKSDDGRKEQRKQTLGCLGVPVGLALGLFGSVWLWDLFVHSKETWLLALLGLAIIVAGVFIVGKALSTLTSVKIKHLP